VTELGVVGERWREKWPSMSGRRHFN